MDALREELEVAVGGRYRLLGEVDRGGMAWVFRARDLKHGRDVAIKVLRPEIAAMIGAQRFSQEIAIAARLNHPHVVPLFDSGSAGDSLYYVMPFIDGESLRARMNRLPPLSPPEALRIARDVAQGLAYAHARGVIHRDIKPENILLAGNSAVVADFGIALHTAGTGESRLTATGIAIGTLAYMSPEQATGSRDVDARTDLYSLGCVLYEMLAGAAPHPTPAGSPRERLVRRLATPPRPLTATAERLPAEVTHLVDRLIAVDPADRPAGADVVVAEIDSALARLPNRTRWKPRVVAVAGIVVALVAGTFLTRGRAPSDRPPGLEARAIAAVAVLPFANLSADPDNEYFSDGLGEELINRLSSVPGLRVAPRTSSWAFRGRDVDLAAIGRTLGVGSVVEGGLRRSGDALRVTARLVRTSDGQALWSGAYEERRVRDVLAIQDSMATAIVGAIRDRLGAELDPDSTAPTVGSLGPARTGEVTGSAQRGATDPPLDVAALDLYWRARFEWNRRSAESIRRAIGLYSDAIRVDSGYTKAWIGLAEAYAVGGFYEYLTPRVAMPEARRAADRALALDPSAGEAYNTLGYVRLWYDWDLPAAEEAFRRALELSPSYAQVHQFYANFLTAAGRFDEALAQWHRAQALEPLGLIMTAAEGWTEYFAGRPERTVEIQRAALGRDSTFSLAHYWLGLGLEGLGRYSEAVLAFEEAGRLTRNGTLALTGLAHVLARRGDRDSALALARSLEARSGDEQVPRVEMAALYAALGDEARALRWLERAAADRARAMVLAELDPRLAPLRDSPRFQRLVRAVRRS